MWQLEQEERRSVPAFPSQPMQLCGWHETPSLPPQMPFNFTCSAQVQALCHRLLLSGSECGGGESADSRLEASEELPSDHEEALGQQSFNCRLAITAADPCGDMAADGGEV